MKKKSVPVSGNKSKAKVKSKRGRFPKPDRGEIVLKNGLYARQWKWIQNEASNKVPSIDAAWQLRFMVQTFIDAVEQSRTDVSEIYTPQDDENHEKLVQQEKLAQQVNHKKHKKE